jgi:hypothetical protein
MALLGSQVKPMVRAYLQNSKRMSQFIDNWRRSGGTGGGGGVIWETAF